MKKLWTWKKALKTLNNLHKKHPITTIHSCWIGECSMIGGRFSKKHDINHVVTVMGQDALPNNSYVNYLQKSTAKIVTLSKNQHAELRTNYALESTIIPWYLDTTSFPKLQKSTIDILGVGSLNTVKNYALFIKIIAKLSETHPNLSVEILGEGNMRAELEQQIEALQLSNAIQLIGKLPREKVLEKMATSKILLHTSAYESFGFVFLEALYAGMHIVSKNVGIATQSEAWKICHTPKEMIAAVAVLLSKNEASKERIELVSAHTSLAAYLKLYHE